MPTDQHHREELAVAASFCLFDKKLRSSGKGSIIWGLLNLLIGAVIIAANDKWGYVSLLLGLGLVVAGIYERTVRDPKVIIVSAGTLAGLALWNFALIALAATGKVRLVLGDRTLIWAIAQAWGAYATWKTYSTYKRLVEKSNPIIVQQVRQYVGEIKKAKPEQTADLIAFESSAGFLRATRRYRLKPIEDMYLVTRYKAELGSLQLEDAAFVPRAEVLLTAEGEKWMSKKMKATVKIGPVQVNKVTITPDMAERINPAVRSLSLGTA